MGLEALAGGLVRSSIALAVCFTNTPQGSFISGEMRGDPSELGGGAAPQREDLPSHFPNVSVTLGEASSEQPKEGAVGNLAVHN